MRVLVACEFSGVVRSAFAALGHEAWSCDILPAEDNGQHIQADINMVLNYPSRVLAGMPAWMIEAKWDLLIAHPPCTFLCNSGVRWLAPRGVLNPERHAQMQGACDLFAKLYWSDIPRVCVENPIMHKYARDYLQSAWKVPKHSQTIQPYEHGHGETKRTCLWLRGLPDLKPSNVVAGRAPRVHFASPSKDRWKERSRTLPGIAAAMAAQWTPEATPNVTPEV